MVTSNPPRISPEALARARLAIALYDATSGAWLETFYFTQNSVTIGRVEGNDLVLNHVTVSRRHLRVWRADHTIFVEDIASTSGLFLNQARFCGPAPFAPHDQLRFGAFAIQCHAGLLLA